MTKQQEIKDVATVPIMTVAQAVDYIITHAGGLDHRQVYAMRGDDVIPRRRFRASFNRPEGVRGTRLQGVCALYVARNDMFGAYERLTTLPETRQYGQYRYLLQGRLVAHGNDEDEVVLADHKIIARISD